MTSPDSPSPRTEAGKRLASRELHDFDDQPVSVTAAILDIERQAAQEAPAPEGLRAAVIDALDALGTMGNGEGWTIEADVIVPLWAALSPEDRARTGYDAEAMAKRYEELRRSRGYPPLSTAPSPAEPPRPTTDDERESGERLARIIQEADAENPEWARGARFVLGWTKGPDGAALEIAFQAVRDPATDPAEARPPEGLDAAWAETMAVLSGDSNFSLSFAADGPEAGWYAMALRPPMSAHEIVGPVETAELALRALAARLSARGAEPR